MAQPLEFVGTVQFWPGGVRGNPVALHMKKTESGECRISAQLPDWRHVVGVGATVNKAAGNYELTLKTAMPADGAYEGPYWNDGIKAEKPASPKPAAAPSAPSSAGGGPANVPPSPTGPPTAPTTPSS